MKAKQKAKELVDNFDFKVRDLDGEVSHTKDESIQCALICVFELWHDCDCELKEKYWEEVKQEINKLF